MKIIAMAFICFSTICYCNAQPVKIHGRLEVEGTQLVDANDNPIVLNGMSFGWSCFHPRFYNEGTVHWLHKDWKCSIVRAAIGIEPSGGYIQDSATAMAKLRTVVNAAIKEGIYVIIGFFHKPIHFEPQRVFFGSIRFDHVITQ